MNSRNVFLPPQQSSFKGRDSSLEQQFRSTQQPASKQGLNLVGALTGPINQIHPPSTSYGESGSG